MKDDRVNVGSGPAAQTTQGQVGPMVLGRMPHTEALRGGGGGGGLPHMEEPLGGVGLQALLALTGPTVVAPVRRDSAGRDRPNSSSTC